MKVAAGQYLAAVSTVEAFKDQLEAAWEKIRLKFPDPDRLRHYDFNGDADIELDMGPKGGAVEFGIYEVFRGEWDYHRMKIPLRWIDASSDDIELDIRKLIEAARTEEERKKQREAEQRARKQREYEVVRLHELAEKFGIEITDDLEARLLKHIKGEKT